MDSKEPKILCWFCKDHEGTVCDYCGNGFVPLEERRVGPGAPLSARTTSVPDGGRCRGTARNGHRCSLPAGHTSADHVSLTSTKARTTWEGLHNDLAEAEAERDRLGEVLEEIRDADPVDMALDPGWASRVAGEALRRS